MGALPAEVEEAPKVDVSAEGTLVWLRRPNGTWWPSIVISPLDVPEGCPAPPRCPAVPIMLLGRRDGTTYVDWCNLERCKRVKPFRCGELDFEHRITKAQALSSTRTHSKSRYARMEDAILQALEIERGRNLHSPGHDILHSPSPSPNKKRKTPNDSEDDGPPKASRRMRDLSDLSSVCHLPVVVTQAKRSKHTHATAKRKHATEDLGHSSGSRKNDRSRPLSELCNGDPCNGNGHMPHASSTGSSGTSTLGAATLHKTCSPSHTGAFKTDQPKLARVSGKNGILSHDSPHSDDFVKAAPLAAPTILEPDHWPTSQPCASPMCPTWKHTNQTAGCSKAKLSSQCEHNNNFKIKIIGSVHQEGRNRTRNGMGHKHHKTKEVKQKASRNEVVLSEEKPDKLTLNKPSKPGDDMHLAVFPADLSCAAAVQQQHSERNRDLRESSGSISNSSDCANGSLVVCELPLQTLPPLKREPGLERCHLVKTMQLNSTLYDVELSAPGISNNGRRVPLVSLMSKWNHKPVVGYPVSVEVSDDVFHSVLSNVGDHQPATSIANGLPKKGKAGGLPSSQSRRGKPKSRKTTSGKEADKLWQPHIKKPASCSPRKMRRLSSFACSQRDGDAGKSVVGKISGATIACIPLRVVFSRIKEALSHPAK